MPELGSQFRTASGACNLLINAADPLERVDEWASLRAAMTRTVPEAFTRDEWAYLITFLDPAQLRQHFLRAFGEPFEGPLGSAVTVYRPRGNTAIWLPNNISLLGSLVLILASLSNNPIRIKAGSKTENLTGAFLAYVRSALPPASGLAAYLRDCVSCVAIDRDDPRNTEMAGWAQVRIVFGSDHSGAAIDAMTHPITSTGFAFKDRRSEIWLPVNGVNDAAIKDILRVFGIYGQAGCTSPRRVLLLGGTASDAAALRDQLATRWSSVMRASPGVHEISNNRMTLQWATALGWEALSTEDWSAVFCSGDLRLEECAAHALLPIIPATLEDALEHLPPNLQTIGHGFNPNEVTPLLARLAATGVKRLVPIARMHHFGPIWDGWEFWRTLFEPLEVEI